MSKGINPAGAEHNKCDILKLLRSAIRLCKLIGDIQQKEMSKKKGGGDAALGTGNSGASVSDKTSPDFFASCRSSEALALCAEQNGQILPYLHHSPF